MNLPDFSPRHDGGRRLARLALAAFLWVSTGWSVASAQATLPRARVGAAYAFQVATNPPAPAGTVYTATGLPIGLSINSSSGAIGGTPAAAGTNNGIISLSSAGITNSFSYTLVVDPALGTPVITSASTAAGTVGGSFSYTVTTDVAATINVGALPPGLTFTSPIIAGTPTQQGTFQVPLSANNAAGTGATRTLTITIAPPAGVPVITSARTATTPLNAPYTYTITANPAALSYSAAGLPVGLSLAGDTISGTPTVAGIYPISISGTNNSGSGSPATLTLTVGAFASIANTGTVNLVVNHPMAPLQLTATNSPLSFNVAGLPPGLAVNTGSGLITGTPTLIGNYTLTLSANNAVGVGPQSTLTLAVAAAPPAGGGAPPVVVTAPVITVHPGSTTVTEGATVTLTTAAAGTGPLSYQWRKDGVNVAGATSATLVLRNVTAADGGSYLAVVTNAAGSATSNAATLTVTALVTPPTITVQPENQTAVVGGTASFTVVVASAVPVTYQWQKNDTPIAGATSATLRLGNVTAADAAAYRVTATNSVGSVTSAAASLSVTTVVTPPSITTAPVSQTVLLGTDVSFSVAASGTGPLTYQWSKDGTALVGATSSSLVLPRVRFADAGSYLVVVTNEAGSATSPAATLVVNPPASRLINLSTRGVVGDGDRTMIAGFVIGGTEPKPVLIRAVGPTLAQFGVEGVVSDPVLELFASAGSRMSNDNWGAAVNAAAIDRASVRVGAFPLSNASADAVILTTLEPGSYTAQVRGNGPGRGVGIVEIYDAGETPAAAKLVNVATRGEVGTGENILIAGFYVAGDEPKRILVRAAGPSLAGFGIEGALADPRVQLYRDGAAVHENDNWSAPTGAGAATGAQITAAATAAGAFTFESGSRDSALLVTLPPGTYSAHVSGVAGATGIALIEVYEVP